MEEVEDVSPNTNLSLPTTTTKLYIIQLFNKVQTLQKYFKI